MTYSLSTPTYYQFARPFQLISVGPCWHTQQLDLFSDLLYQSIVLDRFKKLFELLLLELFISKVNPHAFLLTVNCVELALYAGPLKF